MPNIPRAGIALVGFEPVATTRDARQGPYADEHAIEVWLADASNLADEELRLRLWSLLDDDERGRARRYAFAADRHSFLTGRLVTRLLLGKRFGIPPPDWRIRPDRYGKPTIVAPRHKRHVHISISNTTGVAGCASSECVHVGIDLEDTRRSVDVEPLARRFFSRDEAADVASRSGAGRHARFFEYWTLKEAYVKARGHGFAIPFERFSVALGDNDGTISVREDRALRSNLRWRLHRRWIGEHHVLAVALGSTDGSAARVDVRDAGAHLAAAARATTREIERPSGAGRTSTFVDQAVAGPSAERTVTPAVALPVLDIARRASWT